MIKVTIDGKDILVPKGTNVIDAAAEVGIKIPQLCYLKDKTPFAACRMCIVEIEGKSGVQTACSTLCKDGMVIETETEKIVEMRRTILKLLMSNHPEDCLSCSAVGQCDLQDLCFRYEVSGPFYEGAYTTYELDDNNPVIVRDLDKCIKCGKCVTVCNEVQVTGTYDFANRGFEAIVTTAFNEDLNTDICAMCGQCTEACPVGALQNKQLMKYRPWEVEKVRTTCPFCGTGCNFDLNVVDGKVVGVTTADDAPINRRQTCVKGRFGQDFLHSDERLKVPLIKENGEFREASWDEALDLIASKLKETKEKYGPDALAGLSSARSVNEDSFALQKFFRAVIGTNNIDHCARVCHAPSVAGLAATLGSGAMTNPSDDFIDADAFFIIGSNTTEAHPVIGSKIKQAIINGAKAIVVDPRRTELAQMAEHHIHLTSGTDVAFINGLMHIIIKEGWVDQEYIDERTEGYEEIVELVKNYEPEAVAKLCGTDVETMYKVAELYAKTEKAPIIYGLGITEHTSGVDNVMTLSNLALITGHIGKESAGINPLRGQNNVQGACDMGALPNVYPGSYKVDDPQVHERFEKIWNAELSDEIGLMIPQMFDAAVDGKLKAMIIMGEDVALTDPDANHVRNALDSLDFLVSIEIFMSETSKHADVVLPAPAFAEKNGTFTASERRVQLVNQAIDMPYETRPEWWMIREIARRMGWTQGFEWNSAEDVFEGIREAMPTWRGMTYDRLRENHGLVWPCPSEDHPGTPILHVGEFTREGGKAAFIPCEYREPAEMPDEEYPIVLNTGRRLGHYNVTTRYSDALDELNPYETAEIHPEDAKKHGLDDDSFIRVTSRRGSIVTRIEITDKVREGFMFMSHHFKESPVNELTNSAFDPVSMTGEFKVSAVNIEKVQVENEKYQRFVPLIDLVEEKHV